MLTKVAWSSRTKRARLCQCMTWSRASATFASINVQRRRRVEACRATPRPSGIFLTSRERSLDRRRFGQSLRQSSPGPMTALAPRPRTWRPPPTDRNRWQSSRSSQPLGAGAGAHCRPGGNRAAVHSGPEADGRPIVRPHGGQGRSAMIGPPLTGRTPAQLR
jgi:hypothetical protein